MNDIIKKTSLYEIHKKLNGNMVDFAGVSLPILYSSIQEEHKAVRSNAGLFDVSHMGNIILNFYSREKAINFFNYILPNDFTKIYPGKCIYSTLLNHEGTIIDDLIVMSISEIEYHIIVNASNIEKDYKWIKENINDKDINIENKSDSLSIIAIQGPKASPILANELNLSVDNLKPFHVIKSLYNNTELLISRTGYTGEDGFELIINNSLSISLFEELLTRGKKYGLLPCGLGARDTLRLEASLPLYGHELDDKHSPLQANISWSVKLNKKDDFIGKNAIIRNEAKFTDKLIGFEVLGKAIPRNGMEIINHSGESIGYVTSGTFSPTLQKNIGLAYINKDYLNSSDLKIKIRNRIEDIVIVEIPFYKRSH